ncbi:MAG: glycosyltransferase family 2 protein [Candidatus Poseidoniaceae archaeon]|tara:strand:- start:360 stop:1307 length:948 start_codon:yes stop_codon:yes gene_type:complete
MHNGWHVGVVIPAKDEELFIGAVLDTIPNFVDSVVVIDDGSSDDTSKVAKTYQDKSYNLTVIRLEGKGVGGAIDAGHIEMLRNCPEPFVSVVMAGDGQMDPNDVTEVITPIIEQRCDYVKGNRFIHVDGVGNMPKVRRFASQILAFLTTLAAGIAVSDPQCGYTATSHKVLKEWNWAKSWDKYGYPNYWLIELSRLSFSVVEVPVKSIYGSEKSNLKMLRFLFSVGIMMLVMLHKRCLSMLFNRNVVPHSIFSLVAYSIGWIAIIPSISTDLEREIANSTSGIVFLVGMSWMAAHVFDRMAVKTRIELRKNAQAR